jgi:DNA-binding MarR family transcriptional regulator
LSGSGGEGARDTYTEHSDGTDAPADGTVLREGATVGDELARLMRLAGAWKQRVRDEGWGDRVLLIRLAMDGPRRATDLAADTLLDLSTVSRQIRSLVERGLVERRADPEDGRGTLLSPTESGLAAVQRYRAQRDQMLAEALAEWPGADRREFGRLLARFNDDFTERHVRPVCAHRPGHGFGPAQASGPTPGAGPGAGPAPGGSPAPHLLPHHRASRPTGQTQENS